MIWFLMSAGPVLFLVAIVGASAVLASRGTPAADIPKTVTAWMPQILLLVQLALLVLLLLSGDARSRALTALGSSKFSALHQILVGGAAGGLLALVYLRWVAPALEYLQRTLGDYVPPGEVLPAVSGSLGIFLLANVVLAPLVEESIYRGYAIPVFAERFGSAFAVVLSCVSFGLLHWAGGIWYVLATGILAGGCLRCALSHARWSSRASGRPSGTERHRVRIRLAIPPGLTRRSPPFRG